MSSRQSLGETEGKLATLRNLTDVNAHLGEPMMGNPTKNLTSSHESVSHGIQRKAEDSCARVHSGYLTYCPLPYQFELLQAYGAPFNPDRRSNESSARLILRQLQIRTLRTTPSFQLRMPRSGRRNLDPQPKRNYVMQWNLERATRGV